MMSDYFEGGSDDCVCDDNTSKIKLNLVLRSSGMFRSLSCCLIVTFQYGPSIPSSRVKQSTQNSSWTAASFFRCLCSCYYPNLKRYDLPYYLRVNWESRGMR
jgi:hypothetical protein